ncbi:helix-turn-helix domain-containing protein [Bradyrhizobium sp. 26S5]|uniref:helix-turn-helix domain-containing protein n=1 Tax=Bradyrhizobium sp. 26S5 TaxID=3139729 RepID=UPI0030D050B5
MPITSINKAQPVSGHKGRDRWLGAVIAASGLSPIAVRLAVKLGIFFNCTTGQCNPGYARLAREVAVSRRSVIRAIVALEAGGWIAVDRSDGHHDHKTEFILLMPSVRVTPDVTPTGDKDMSPVQAAGRVTKNSGTGDKGETERVTHAVTTNEPEEPEEPEGRAYGARTSRVDRESAASNSANTADDETSIQRAPGGALIETFAAQKQKPPERNETEMGTAANGRAAPSPFAQVLSVYPADRVGDEAKAYFAFDRALAARGSLSVVLEDIASLMQDYGDDVPFLVDLMKTIERIS